jgi:hypothetical protein
MTTLIIVSVDQNPAPKRIALGGNAYTIIRKALTERRAVLEAKRRRILVSRRNFPPKLNRVCGVPI